jgi:hypothetical protein
MGDTDGNKLLRMALLAAWNGTCYWCGRPRTFREVEIDHIIPRTGAQGEREKLVKDLLGQQALDLGYDYDVPANLAPICPTPCNREKRADLFRSARFEGLLRRARKKAEGVVRFVESYRSPDRVQAALMAVTMADLSDQRSREVLEEVAAVLDAQLRSLNYKTVDELVDPHDPEQSRIVITVDEDARRAMRVIETLTGHDFNSVILGSPIKALRRAVGARLLGSIIVQLEDEGNYEPDVDEDIVGRRNIHITELRYVLEEQQFQLTGTFDADGSGVAAVSSTDGSDLDYIQRDAAGHGGFLVRFWIDEAGPETTVDDIEIDWKDGPAAW